MSESKEQVECVREILGAKKAIVFALLSIILCSAILEGFGISLILPILQVVIEGDVQGKAGEILRPFLSRFPERYGLVFLAGGFFVVILLRFFATFLRIVISKKFVWKMRLQWMKQIFEKYMRAEYAFILNHKQGELLNNLIAETQRGAMCFSQSIEFAARLVIFIALLVTLFLVHWQITIILVLVIGLLLFLTHRITKDFAQRIGRRRLRLSQQLSAEAAEAISAVRQIKTFGLEDRFCSRAGRINTKLCDVHIKLGVTRAMYTTFGEFLLGTLVAGVIIYISLFLNDSLKVFLPVLGVFIIIGQRLMSSVSMLAGLRLQIISLLPSALLSHQLSSDTITEEVLSDGMEIQGIETDIVFENVTFAYNGGKKVVEGLNLTIPLGKTTAVIGPSGIGKSTIADLLLRLYDPQDGQILVNSKALKDWNLASWRQHIGFVSQDTFLFDMSIRDNIALGNPEAAEEQIIEAAKKAYAHDFIMELPQAYDTVVGERGATLSGGQRQRIAIARAIVRDPDFLIFDEATSSLDHDSEEMVRRAIEELGREKTMVVIAHRFSTIEKADKVCDLRKKVKDKNHSHFDQNTDAMSQEDKCNLPSGD